MRLIDSDALLEQKVFRYNRDTEYHENSGVTEAACEIIDAPTIDAIPVEWLEQKREKEMIDLMMNVYGRGNSDLCHAICVVLEAWKKEQEAR